MLKIQDEKDLERKQKELLNSTPDFNLLEQLEFVPPGGYAEAFPLVKKILNSGMRSRNPELRIKSLTAFIRFRQHLNTDTTYPIECLMSLGKEKAPSFGRSFKKKETVIFIPRRLYDTTGHIRSSKNH